MVKADGLTAAWQKQRRPLQCAPQLVTPTAVNIGAVRLRNPVLLAPMAGYTDYPMRRMVWALGGGLTTGEMTAAAENLWNTPKSTQRRRHAADAGPCVIQLAGSEPEVLARAARRQVDEGAEIIDLNFGCPAKKVCNRAAGSALLGDPQLVGRIIEAVVAAVSVPVTAKIRTGLRPDDRNGLLIARIAEQAGAQSLVVHGRTRACRFLGEAEYETIGCIRADLRIPVIANGDIGSFDKMCQVLLITGASGVMIGRSAVGAPWLPGVLAGQPAPTRRRQCEIMLEHLDLMHECYMEEDGYRLVRKHVIAYLRNLRLDEYIAGFNAVESARSQRLFLQQMIEREITE